MTNVRLTMSATRMADSLRSLSIGPDNVIPLFGLRPMSGQLNSSIPDISQHAVLRAGIAFLLGFLALTLWDVSIGLFEKPSVNAPHFVAGAGNLSLLARVGLGFLAAISLLIYGTACRFVKGFGLCLIVIVLIGFAV